MPDPFCRLQQFHQQGLERGSLAASRTAVLDALCARFESVPVGLRESLDSVTDPSRLRHLLITAIRFESIEAFVKEL